MIAVIGLGNPGKEYAHTRHNVGWFVLDMIANGQAFDYDKYLLSEKCSVSIDGQQVLLIKPQTFMNESGKVMDGLKKLNPYVQIVVVHDELDLAVGSIRVAYARGDGGHNGIKSINNFYGGKEYTRVRVGISKTGENGELYKPNVLGDFDESDKAILKDALPKAVEAVKMIVSHGKDTAANLINQK